MEKISLPACLLGMWEYILPFQFLSIFKKYFRYQFYILLSKLLNFSIFCEKSLRVWNNYETPEICPHGTGILSSSCFGLVNKLEWNLFCTNFCNGMWRRIRQEDILAPFSKLTLTLFLFRLGKLSRQMALGVAKEYAFSPRHKLKLSVKI